MRQSAAVSFPARPSHGNRHPGFRDAGQRVRCPLLRCVYGNRAARGVLGDGAHSARRRRRLMRFFPVARPPACFRACRRCVVGDGEAAFELAKTTEFDLLLADVVMPWPRRHRVGSQGLRTATGHLASCSSPALPRWVMREESWLSNRPRVLAKPFHLRHLIDEIEALLLEQPPGGANKSGAAASRRFSAALGAALLTALHRRYRAGAKRRRADHQRLGTSHARRRTSGGGVRGGSRRQPATGSPLYRHRLVQKAEIPRDVDG